MKTFSFISKSLVFLLMFYLGFALLSCADNTSGTIKPIGGTPTKYKITYDLNDGTGTAPVDSKIYERGDNATILDKSSDMVKTGFNFGGWAKSAQSTISEYSAGSSFVMDSADVILYAVWITPQVTYTVTYDINGGAGTPPIDNNKYVTSAIVSVMDKTASMTRTNYSFLGWANTNNATTSDYTVGQTFQIVASNVTLYAIWKISVVTITYDIQGWSWNGAVPTNQTGQPGQTVNVDTTYLTQLSNSVQCIPYGWKDKKTKKTYGRDYNKSIILGNENIDLQLDYGQNDLQFSLKSTGEYYVSRGTCTSKAPLLPSGYHGYPITAIKNLAWSSQAILEIGIPYWVTSIEDSAFSASGLNTIYFATGAINNLTNVGDFAFANTKITSRISFGPNISYIGASAFQNCPIAAVSFATPSASNTSLTIKEKAFYGTSIAYLEIPENIKTIYSEIVPNGTSFTTLRILATNPPVFLGAGSSTFIGLGNSTASIYVPKASITSYKTAMQTYHSGQILGF